MVPLGIKVPMKRCRDGLYDVSCDKCRVARGALRPHRKLDPADTTKAVLF